VRSRHLVIIAAVALFAAFGPPERTAPTKWALVVGISDYMNFGDEIGGDLPGAANDARAMADVLVNRYGFAPENVKLVLDASATRDRLQAEFREWLPSVARQGDLVYFFFAGHGSQAWDLDADEADGLDETICPADVMRGNTEKDIIDDEFAEWLRGVPTDNVVVVWDKCHAKSSTRAVTPFARPRALGRDAKTDVPKPTGAEAAPSPEEATEVAVESTGSGVMEIAASQADEVAIDAAFPSEQGTKYGGAFTTNFVRNMWTAPEGATYEDVFNKTKQDMRRQRFRQEPGIDENPKKDLPLFALAEIPEDPEEPPQPIVEEEVVAGEIGFVPILELPTEQTALLGGGSMADMTERSLYKAGQALLSIDEVMPEQAMASVVTRETRGFTVIARDALAAGSRARLVAYRYPDQILRVSIADLPSAAQSELRQALMMNPALALIGSRDAYANYIVRPRGDYYVVLNLDGFPRDSVEAPDPVTGAQALVPVLQREFQAYQLAELENPAQPFEIQFEFANGRNDFRVGEEVSFRVRSERAGYLTMISVEPNGEVIVLFPNELDQNNAIQAGEVVVWPTEAMGSFVEAQPPTGKGIVRAFVTERPMIVPLSVGEVVSGAEVWRALKNAAGRPPVQGSDAVPVENWATTAIMYEVRP